MKVCETFPLHEITQIPCVCLSLFAFYQNFSCFILFGCIDPRAPNWRRRRSSSTVPSIKLFILFDLCFSCFYFSTFCAPQTVDLWIITKNFTESSTQTFFNFSIFSHSIFGPFLITASFEHHFCHSTFVHSITLYSHSILYHPVHNSNVIHMLTGLHDVSEMTEHYFKNAPSIWSFPTSLD